MVGYGAEPLGALLAYRCQSYRAVQYAPARGRDADDVVSTVRSTMRDYHTAGLDKPLVVAFATNGAYSTATRELCQRLARATNQELLDITGRLACTFAAASWDAVVLCHPIVTHSVPLAPITSTQHSRITPSSAIPTRAS